MSGWSIFVHGKVFDEDALFELCSSNWTALSPTCSDLLAYVLFVVGMESLGEGSELETFVSGFKGPTYQQLKMLRPISSWDGDSPQSRLDAWDPPLVKAAALRALIEPFRRRDPSALYVWEFLTTEGYIRPILMSDVADGDYHKDVAPNDWGGFIARDLEQLAKELEFYAAQGEISVCLELNS